MMLLNRKKVFRMIKFALLLVVTITLAGCKTVESTEQEFELNTEYTDGLKLTQVYEGKSFFTDKIGEATLVECGDGDTAVFRTSGQTIRVRFLGIDTPETATVLDAWGKPASNYTCEKLTNATSIVLEGDYQTIDSTGTRYLAWIWVDGRLLNLEIIEEAYSKLGAVSNTKYSAVFELAESKTKKTKKRIWGEKDPTFDYTNTIYPVTIAQIKENPEAYFGKKIIVTGLITRTLANHAYIEQDGFGLYVYAGYDIYPYLKTGNKLSIIANITEYNGSLQLTSLDKTKMELISKDNDIIPTVKTISDLNDQDLSAFIKLTDLKIKSVSPKGNRSEFTIYAADLQNKEIAIRIDPNVFPEIDANKFKVGEIIDVSGLLGEFNNSYQVMLILIGDVNFKDN